MGSKSVGHSDKLWWSGLDRHDRNWMLNNQTNVLRERSRGWSNQKDNPRADSWGWNNPRGSLRDNPNGSC